MIEAQDGELAAIEALVRLHAADLPWGEVYLERAQALLAPLLPEERYAALRQERAHLGALTRELRQGAERGDWATVRTLAQRGARDRHHLAAHQRLLALGDVVYGPRVFVADADALALSGLIVRPSAHLGRARDECVAWLRLLIARDRERADFYRARLAHFERLEVVADVAAPTPVSAGDVQRRIIEAAEKGDFDQAERLSAALLVAMPESRLARVRIPLPPANLVESLRAPFADDVARRAEALGLAMIAIADDGALNDYLSCDCAARAAFPERPLTETHRAAAGSTCGHAYPPGMSGTLRQALDLLMLHPFVTSAGTRYLPYFGAETLLVETVPESDPNARTPLLDALALPRRRALSRRAIEDCVRRRGPRVCADLGLDPAAYAVVPIPFDVYLRLAPQFGWGRQALWTHFDGYQVTEDLHLRALVGGDVTYGGPEDLCSVANDYDTERLTARFAIVRRDRFAARETPPVA
ncbi:hypothetical protein KF840_01875 [bacterium]|nr:hypothetical protein [bacterium]